MIKSKRINGRTDVKISGEGMPLVAEMAIVIEKVYESLDEIDKRVFKDNWDNFCPFIPKEERMKKSIEHITDSFLKLLGMELDKKENDEEDEEVQDIEEKMENSAEKIEQFLKKNKKQITGGIQMKMLWRRFLKPSKPNKNSKSFKNKIEEISKRTFQVVTCKKCKTEVGTMHKVGVNYLCDACYKKCKIKEEKKNANRKSK